MEINFDGWVRRIDLHFRARYPYITTRIFRLTQGDYEILCVGDTDKFDELQKQFDENIRFITAPVSLALEEPQNILYEIGPISDKDIPRQFEGLPLSKSDMACLLMGKFPSLQIIDVITEGPGRVLVEVHKDNEGIIPEVLTFLEAMKLPQLSRVEVGQNKPKINYHQNPIVYIFPTKLSRAKFRFAERDEALWYDSISDIFSGQLKKNNLFFFDEDSEACFCDFSVWKNINLRNHLLLYDVIYLVPPFHEYQDSFFKDQCFEKRELLELIRKGRIKIILNQPEERYRPDLLSEIQEVSLNSIISRRAVSLLCAADIVEISNAYKSIIDVILPIIHDLSAAISDVLQWPTSTVEKSLLWPLAARRQCFESLHYGGTKTIASFGVNKIASELVNFITGRELEFEFVVSSENIHISSALGATYFPISSSAGHTDFLFVELMGNLLNIFSNIDPLLFQGYLESQIQRAKGIIPIDPIVIFEVDSFVPLDEFNGVVSRVSRRDVARSLMSELAEMEHDQRKATIDLYNKEVELHLSNKKKMDLLLDLSTEASPVPFLGPFIKAGRFGIRKISEKFPKVDRFFDSISDDLHGNEGTYKKIRFLTEINRVARLRKDYR